MSIGKDAVNDAVTDLLDGPEMRAALAYALWSSGRDAARALYPLIAAARYTCAAQGERPSLRR